MIWRLKFWQFLIVSTLLSSLVIAKAFHLKNGEFYSSVVHMTKSSLSITIISIQSLSMIWGFFRCCQLLLFGRLRAIEAEHVMEKSWYAITESALAFTVFREELNASFIAAFTFLLAVKCAHWIGEDRTDLIERSPTLPTSYHVRMIGLMFLLLSIDAAFVQYNIGFILSRGATVHLVYAFEYAVLYANLFMIAVKYTLHSIDQRRHFGWDRKVIYLLYAELVTSLFRIILYTGFISLLLSMKIFALFAVRPAFMAVRSFSKTLTDVIRSRIAIRNLNTLFPDASSEDLQSVSDPLCIICREEMLIEGENARTCKKLPCGHIFHVTCLRSWFQRQQSCPTCRADVVRLRNNNNSSPERERRRQNRQPNEIEVTNQSHVNVHQILQFQPLLVNIPPPPTQYFNFMNVASNGSSPEQSIEQLQAREAALIAELEARTQCLNSVRQCLESSVGQLKTSIETVQAMNRK